MKNLILYIILYVVLCFPCWGLNSTPSLDEYHLDSWDTSTGLPSDSIDAMAQGPDGYIWISTAKGLVRYDGMEFERIALPKTRKNGRQRIHRLYVDGKGVLWLGGEGLLGKYQNQRLTWLEPGLPVSRVSDIKEGLDGAIWISQYPGHLARFREDAAEPLEFFHQFEEEKTGSISELIVDGGGEMLLCTKKRGIFKYRGPGFERVAIPGAPAGLEYHAISMDRSGFLWAGTTSGLICTRGNISRVITTFDGLSNDIINSLMEDRGGNLWVGTYHGLNRIKRSLAGETAIDNFLEKATITCIMEDREGGLWAGTVGSGLKRLKKTAFRTYTEKDGLPADYIISVEEMRGGVVWVGAKYGGVYQFEKGRFSPIDTGALPLKHVWVKAFLPDEAGHYWIGAFSYGLIKFTPPDKTVLFNEAKGLVGSCVRTLCKDGKGRLWVGTRRGANVLDGEKILLFDSNDGLLGNTVYNVIEDSQKRMWVTSQRGVNRIPGGDWKSGAMDTPVVGPAVYFVREDKDGTFWLGTGGKGIIRLKQDEQVYIGKEHGLGSNTVYHMLVDEFGDAWFSSESGIMRVNKQNLEDFCDKKTDKVDCISYSFSDGLIGLECQDHKDSAMKTRKGELWFATMRGVSVVNPRALRQLKLPPAAAVIEKVSAEDKEIVTLEHGHVPLTLENGAAVEFHFTAPYFTAPERVGFKYKLEGVDDGWVQAGETEPRKAVYKDLSGGDYTFSVLACNSNGTWSASAAFFSFSVQSSLPGGTVVMISALLLIAGLGGFFFLQSRKRAQQEEQQKYKTSSLEESRADGIKKQLLYLLEVEKIFTGEELSLKSLAQKMKVPGHHLSQVINEKCGKNFFELINSYRVEEAKRQLIDPKNKGKKIIDILFEVGFNTKVAFNNAFKKFTGMTPSQYRKEHQE